MDSYTFTAPLWQWQARQQTWTFVTLPDAVADEVEECQTGLRRGFGAVKVRVSLGSTTWETSMFPSRERGSYILPVKAAVRRAEGIDVGESGTWHITLIEG